MTELARACDCPHCRRTLAGRNDPRRLASGSWLFPKCFLPWLGTAARPLASVPRAVSLRVILIAADHHVQSKAVALPRAAPRPTPPLAATTMTKRRLYHLAALLAACCAAQRGAAATITTVGTAAALREAFERGAEHIEIVRHLDLTALPRSPASPAKDPDLFRPGPSTKTVRVRSPRLRPPARTPPHTQTARLRAHKGLRRRLARGSARNGCARGVTLPVCA